MQRSEFLEGVYAVAAAVPIGLPIAMSEKTIAGIRIVDTTAAKAATRLASNDEPAAIFNHSLRTFFFAELVAKAQGTKHDVEAVYIASILHDIGLSKTHITEKERFEVDGANAARALLESLSFSKSSIDLIWDAISLHDNGGIARWKQPEVRLVNAGVSADFGAFLETMKRDDVVAVLRAAPRDNFIPVFLDAVAEIARKKPNATGNCFVTDVGYRMVPGFHLANFCDEVKDDPFSSFK